jgi:glycine oxidase
MPDPTPYTQHPTPDVTVIGAGIIGLSVAWHLAREGASVTVLERGTVGCGASGAAAGMLAPLAEAKKPGAFVELGMASLRRYPDFIEALKEEAGLDPNCGGSGLLRVALDEAGAQALCTASEWQEAAGLRVEQLSSEEVRRLEPELTDKVVAAVLSRDEQQFDPVVLTNALAIACRHRGVDVREGCAVTGLKYDGSFIRAVQTMDGPIPCGKVVVAGGAWSEEIGRHLNVALPVFPVRGQIMALNMEPPTLRHTIYAHHGYLVPRGNGRIIVGATAEEAGFDCRPTAGGMAWLLETARSLVPKLSEASFDSVWAGLRPATPDGLPIIGRLPGYENAYAATGHFRNGILLAPITGALVTDLILKGEKRDLQPFLPERFQ